MRRKSFLLMVLVLQGIGICQAQSDSAVQACTGAEKKPSQHLYLFNKTANSSVNFSSFRQYAHSYGSFRTENLHLKNSSSDDIYFKTDCPLYLRKGEFDRQWESGINVHYNPMNPYGATSGIDGLIMGSLFFLFDQLIPEK